MRNIYAVLLILVPPFLTAGDIAKEAADVKQPVIANVAESSRTRGLWLTSIGAMLGANVADVVTSYQDSKVPGLHELNPLVSSGGQYNLVKGISFKAVMCGAMLGYEIRDHHKNGSAHEKPQAVANFLNAGLFAIVSAHNHSLSSK